MNRFWWTFSLTVGRLFQWFALRQKTTRKAALPEGEAFIVLGNHAAAIDPMAVFFSVMRPVHFMASEQLFRNPRSGPWVRRINAFPKAKYARDKDAIAKVLEHNAAGRVVGLFPEGNRSWDGRPLPIRPGLGWLLKKVDGPVVFSRNFTAWLAQPRWARYPRYVPIQVEVSEPVRFPEDWTTAQIEEDVQKRLAIDPATVELTRFAWGYKLAHGLPTYLWACPACFELEALEVDPADDDGVHCTGCAAAWRLDVRTNLHPVRGDAEATTVALAHDAITSHFGELPTTDADRFVDTGLALEGGQLKVYTVEDQALTLVADGDARLTSEALTIGEWQLPLKPLKAISIELGNVLQARTADALYQFETDSPLKWRHFLAAHHAASRPQRRGRRRS